VLERWLDKIRPAVRKLDTLSEACRRQRAIISDLYDRAGGDGCNRKGFKDAIALLSKPADEVALEARTTGRILRIADHPLVTEHGLFPDLPFEPKPPSPYQSGLTVGRAAGSVDECPFIPGTPDFNEWRDGWSAGQKQNFESLRKTSDTVGTA
jgi:hypothetical protein